LVISGTQGVDDASGQRIGANQILGGGESGGMRHLLGYWYHSSMKQSKVIPRRFTPGLRTVIEIGLLIFFFYSVRLMGEFTATSDRGKTLSVAIQDILTGPNLLISGIAALAGYLVIEYLRKEA
jgi:hypothetical protein